MFWKPPGLSVSLSSALPAYIREVKISQKKPSTWSRNIFRFFKEGFAFFLTPVNWSLTNSHQDEANTDYLSQTTGFPLAYCLSHGRTPYIRAALSHICTTLSHCLSWLNSWWYPPGRPAWHPPSQHSSVWVVPTSPSYSVVVQFPFTNQTEETQPGSPCP